MKNQIFNVPTMKSAHCQATVTKAIEAVEGAGIQHIGPGTVTVTLAADDLQATVFTAIEKAGYRVHLNEQ
ncbi:heavy-metal-associated domain-containing protein [Chitinophaga varians]|uniref:heavy-metal-associated domain-containing protein n=1 Tax=Chitinophaga varians TaxID=2202339 RepID=UPI00165F1E68|nr:heavy-metal-associated domain-containing protein [Chitinophaga varians]MBC9911696.1 heavy-metal-associated domain-containing protein [Chitinophaga varians]